MQGTVEGLKYSGAKKSLLLCTYMIALRSRNHLQTALILNADLDTDVVPQKPKL